MLAEFVLYAMPLNAAFRSLVSNDTETYAIQTIHTHKPYSGVMVWGAISYHGRSKLLQIKGIPGATFQQDNARPHVAKTVRGFCSGHRMQLLPLPLYSPDMSPIEHVLYLVGQHLAHDPRHAASKNKIVCAYKQYDNLYHKQTFKICLTSCHVV
ncbi:uncharacterized protein TNCV_3902051 [Trichonephila clavipes]|nr:uncharacterized protein TNCV_3902051 [Trichonephila clavipes]